MRISQFCELCKKKMKKEQGRNNSPLALFRKEGGPAGPGVLLDQMAAVRGGENTRHAG